MDATAELDEPVIYTNVKLKKSKATKVPDSVRTAAKEYKRAYHDVYGVTPEIRWDGTWFAIAGQSSRVMLRRLKELTTLLRYKAGDAR